MQSKLTINSVDYLLDIDKFTEQNRHIINEKTTIPNPDNYANPNTVLVASGYNKHVFNISGNCSLADRLIFITAMKNNTKVYPVIYLDSTNLITTSAYYYFMDISGNIDPNDERYYYNISLILGGT